VVIGYPCYLNTTSGVFDAGSPARILTYVAAINSIIDGEHIFLGFDSYNYFLNNLSQLQGDGVHPTQTGSDHMADGWASTLTRIVNAITNTNVWYPAAFSGGFAATLVSGVYVISGGGASFRHEDLTAVAGNNTLTLGGAPVTNTDPQFWLLKNGTRLVITTDYTIASNVVTLVTPASGGEVYEYNLYTLTSSPANATLTTVGPTVTWNPADHSPNIALSGSNLIATSTGTAQWEGFRATLSRDAATSNHAFEVLIGAVSGGGIIGLGNASAGIAPGQYVGQDGNSGGYYSTGNTSYAGGTTANCASYTAGDVIMVLLKNGKIYTRKNGVWQNSGDPIAQTGYVISALSGMLFPMGSLFGNGDNLTGRFKAADITGSLPAGTSAWQ